jgi:nitronate monooxygenase
MHAASPGEAAGMRRPLPFCTEPLILAPIAGPGTVALTAAAMRGGAFGFLAEAYASGAQIREHVRELREQSDAPFGINLFVERESPVSDEALARANARLDRYRDELGIPAGTATRPAPLFDEQFAAVLQARPAVFSVTFGIPPADAIAACRAAGIFTMATATCVAEARAIEAAGVDAVIAQGAEAGGHRGSFLDEAHPPLIGTIALVPQIVDAVRIPVIASGGITDGRGIAAALMLGASAVQIGTAFLLADEAATSAPYRRALAAASDADTVLTRAFSGRYARGIANRMTRELAQSDEIAPFPYQNALTRDIRAAAARAESSEYLSLWAGQAAPLARDGSAETIARDLIAHTHEVLAQR